MSNERQNLIEFPTRFPIKVMGGNHPEFAVTVLDVVRAHAPETEAAHLDIRNSSKGNYLSCTITVYAQSQEQLDRIYRALSVHPLVKVVL